MSFDGVFRDRVVLITGATSGVGMAVAAQFGQAGAKVIVNGRSSSKVAATVSSLQKQHPGTYHGAVADVSREKDVISMFSEVELLWGSIDFLINNAGALELSPIADLSEEAWDLTMDVNVKGTFLCSREMFRQQRRSSKKRCIINVASVAGIPGIPKFPGTSAYVASKYAAIGLSEVLATEGFSQDIRVNVVAPGRVNTPLLEKVPGNLRSNLNPEQIATTILQIADPVRSGHLFGAVVEIPSGDRFGVEPA